MINVCLIGYGYWGTKLARNFQNSESFNLISIVDIKRKKLLLAKKNHPLTEISVDYKKIIKKNVIDLVIISSTSGLIIL